MSQENKETREFEELEKENESVVPHPKSSLRPAFIALSVIGAIILVTAAILVFRGLRQGGEAVPAPRSVSFDESSNPQSSLPAEGQTITLLPEQAERINLKIETVGETMSVEAARVSANGVVEPNSYSETPVISLVGGVVRKIGAQLGDSVTKGQTVLVVYSDDFAAAQSRYLSLRTEAQTARQNHARAAKLVRLNPVSRTEMDEAQARVKIKEAELDEMRLRYQRTSKLVEIGASSREEFEQDRTKLKTAEAEVEQARKQLTRTAELVKLNPVALTEFEQAAVKSTTAESELANARQRLILLGLSEDRVNSLRSPNQISSEIAVSAPVSGTITSRSVNQGEVIEANKETMKVTNLSSVWVIAQVYEKDLGKMRTGTGASVTSDAFPERLFRGQVTYIDPNINQETRTAQVRIELENPGRIFRIGMYVNVSFGAVGMSELTVPVIPAAAVQNLREQTIVFAATEKPNVFLMKPVRLIPEKTGLYVVLEGLNVGDKIVTEGSFLLRAEMLKQNP